MRPPAGTPIPDSPFRDDDGSADPHVSALIRQWQEGAVEDDALALALQGARLMVPVMAVLDSVETAQPGVQVEKDSHMAVPLMVRADGRRGLLAFTSMDSARLWQQQARAVPVRGRDVATAALAEGADALVIDVMGPVRVPVQGAALALMAGTEPQQR